MKKKLTATFVLAFMLLGAGIAGSAKETGDVHWETPWKENKILGTYLP